ncbi:MAG TPA: restriction endonuclease [Xanthomonadales bacterium]|nr:restriction endonuclease [Xanthomonadales bacterium]
MIEAVLASVYRASNNPENVIIKRNVQLAGSTRDEKGRPVTHQIDVFVELRLPLITHQIVVQAKRWSSRVKKEQVLTFAQILSDLPGQPRGMMVAESGFQSGALQYARAHGIELFALQSLNDAPLHVARVDPSVNKYFDYAFWAATLECVDPDGAQIEIDLRPKNVRLDGVLIGNDDRGWKPLRAYVTEARACFLSDMYHVPEDVPSSGFRYGDFPEATEYRILPSPTSRGFAKSIRMEFWYEYKDNDLGLSFAESFEHYLTNLLTGKLWLVDREGGTVEKATLSLCDFCGTPLADGVGTDFGCADIVMEHGNRAIRDHMFVSDWRACEDCTTDVMNEDRESLIARAIEVEARTNRNVNVAGMMQAHSAFWSGRTGSVKPRTRSDRVEL